MFTFFDIFLLLCVFVLCYVVHWYLSIPKNLPPGSVLDVINANTLQHRLKEYAKKYGPLYKFYMMDKLMVVLADYDTIHETFIKQGDTFAGRPESYFFAPHTSREAGILDAEGELWKEHRRFALSTLRDLGVGRPVMERKVKEETEYLIQWINKKYVETNEPFDPSRVLVFPVSNVLSQLIFGKRFDYDQPEFFESLPGVTFISPIVLSKTLHEITLMLPVVKKLRKQFDRFIEYLFNLKDETVLEYDEEEQPSNYIHAYTKASKNSSVKSFTEIQLRASILDLYGAGVATTFTTLNWAILYLSCNPEFQERMYNEIKDKLGVSNPPDYADSQVLHWGPNPNPNPNPTHFFGFGFGLGSAFEKMGWVGLG